MGARSRPEPGSPEARRELEADLAYRAAQAEKAAMREMLLGALARGGDVLYQVQRLIGHDLVRHGLISGELRFVSSGGEAADLVVEVNPPEQVIEHHDASNAELLDLVRVRLNDDGRILQAEREQLVSLAREILGRLGRMQGR